MLGRVCDSASFDRRTTVLKSPAGYIRVLASACVTVYITPPYLPFSSSDSGVCASLSARVCMRVLSKVAKSINTRWESAANIWCPVTWQRIHSIYLHRSSTSMWVLKWNVFVLCVCVCVPMNEPRVRGCQAAWPQPFPPRVNASFSSVTFSVLTHASQTVMAALKHHMYTHTHTQLVCLLNVGNI